MGENKKYFWLKLYNDFFSSKRIKRLRSLAGGDTYTIIYLKMQLKALKDDGYLYFDGVMDEFAEELALDIDENPDDVRMTIQYLLRVGLMESSEDGKEYFLTYVPKCIGSETASAQRVRNYRARKKEQEALPCNADETPMKQIETKCNTEIEKEIDINKETNKEINKETKIGEEIEAVNTTVFNEKVELWNSLSTLGIAPIRSITANGKRATFLRARFKEYGEDSFKEVVQAIRESSFLQGKHSGRPWQATFDWVILPSNYPKVLEGNYKDCEKRSTTDWSQIN